MKTAQDIMTRNVLTVSAEMPVEKLAALFLEQKISGAPVMEGDRVVGVVTESDLIDQNKNVHIPTVISILDSYLFLESTQKMDDEIKKMTGRTVGSICSKKLTVVSEDTPLSEVATIMAEKNIHTLPVLKGDKLVGVIGKTDMIRTMIG